MENELLNQIFTDPNEQNHLKTYSKWLEEEGRYLESIAFASLDPNNFVEFLPGIKSIYLLFANLCFSPEKTYYFEQVCKSNLKIKAIDDNLQVYICENFQENKDIIQVSEKLVGIQEKNITWDNFRKLTRHKNTVLNTETIVCFENYDKLWNAYCDLFIPEPLFLH